MTKKPTSARERITQIKHIEVELTAKGLLDALQKLFDTDRREFLKVWQTLEDKPIGDTYVVIPIDSFRRELQQLHTEVFLEKCDGIFLERINTLYRETLKNRGPRTEPDFLALLHEIDSEPKPRIWKAIHAKYLAREPRLADWCPGWKTLRVRHAQARKDGFKQKIPELVLVPEDQLPQFPR